MDNNEIRKQMELDQKRAFCKQSCTKIDQGLDKLDPRSGERAIWELFQNARDLARLDNGNKTAHIKITLTPTEFIFAHKGQPFDHDSLTSLVMQVSSRGKENDDTVGQYGTSQVLWIWGNILPEPTRISIALSLIERMIILLSL